MKRFLAIYIGTDAAFERWKQLADEQRRTREAAGMVAWKEWMETHKAVILEVGGPLGKTKRVAPDGITNIKNVMSGFTIVAAESHEAAAKLFEDHPHFSIFPGDSIEVMECMPIPGT
jgi:hypothetical protein